MGLNLVEDSYIYELLGRRIGAQNDEIDDIYVCEEIHVYFFYWN